MSSRDDPFGGGGGKTVIRPNPGGGGQGPAGGGGIPNPGGGGGFPNQGMPNPYGGGLPNPGGMRPMPGQPMPGQAMPGQPAQPQWPVQQPSQPQWPPAQPGPGYNPRVTAPGYQNAMPGVGGMPNTGSDDWLRGPSGAQQMFPSYNQQQAAPVDTPKIPLEVALNARDGGQISAANPITAAAAPLLILLGRLRLQIVELQAQPLMAHVANQIMAFERNCSEAGVDPNDIRVAKYALCGTADDIIQNLPGDKAVWLQYSMLAQFFQVRTSGVGFYEELNKILHNPAPRYNLLELMHACLSLGFEGQYRGSPNGANELARIRRDVYQTLRHLKSRADDDVSPHWRGLQLKMRELGSRVPMWAIGTAAVALLVAVFFVLRILLGGDTDTLSDKLIALNPTIPITLERTSNFVPAKVPDTRDQTQLERIRANLGTVDDKCVAADSVGDSIVIKVCNVLLFDSGSATVKKQFADLAKRIAASLQNEPGPINITGYTDNVKPSGVGRYKSNYDLSMARAKAVEDIISPGINDASRLHVEGKGELDPIADNSTDEGRAQNRRVEITIPRQETLPQQT